jgi:hypothetical protein
LDVVTDVSFWGVVLEAPKLVQQKFIHIIIGKNTNNNSYPQDCSKFQKVEQCQCKHDKSGNQTPGNVMYG